MNPLSAFVTAMALAASAVSTVSAHFIFIIPPEAGKSEVGVVFGEMPAPAASNDLLNYLDGIELTYRNGEKPLSLDTATGKLVGNGTDTQVFACSKQLGVIAKGGEPFVLNYYATGGPAPDQWSWRRKTDLRLQVTPSINEERVVTLKVTFDGKPAVGAEVVFGSADGDGDDSGETDDAGKLIIGTLPAGLAWARAKVVEEQSGELDGHAYQSIKHYSTTTFHSPSTINRSIVAIEGGPSPYPALPREITSFGATRLGDEIYVYGGHTGDAHSYSRDEQSNELWSLNLAAESPTWQVRSKGQNLQGNALVAAAGKVVLIGGFTANNAEGEEHDLQSRSDVRAFDPSSNLWTELPSLPRGRSSFDACIIDDVIYVVGGWTLGGESDHVWQTDALKLDISSAEPRWIALKEPPVQNRALATVAFEGKLYAIGGMTEHDGPTTGVIIYDPAQNEWTVGPHLLGSAMNGFGCAAVVLNERLYATTYDGTVQRLSKDGNAWEAVGEMPKRRFFHRLIPVDKKQLAVIGGGDMSVGKYADVDLLSVLAD